MASRPESRRRYRPPPEKQIEFLIPDAISGRLDVLVALATDAAKPTSRRELISALIIERRALPDLKQLLTDYRLATVRDSLIPGQDTRHFLRPSRQKGLRVRLFSPEDLEADSRQDEGEENDPNELLEKRLAHMPKRRVGIAVPSYVDLRLTAVVELLEYNAERTSRQEIVAALTLAAPSSGQELPSLLARYRGFVARRASTKPRGRGRPR